MGRIADFIRGQPEEQQTSCAGGFRDASWGIWEEDISTDPETNADPLTYTYWRAQQLVPIAACVNVLARSVGACRIQIEELKGGDWKAVTSTNDLPLWCTEGRTSRHQTLFEFLASLTTFLLTSGNGYIVNLTYRDNVPAQMAAISSRYMGVSYAGRRIAGPEADIIEPLSGVSGLDIGYYANGKYIDRYEPGSAYADAGDMTCLHTKLPGSDSLVIGASPLSTQAPAWRLGLAAEAHTELMFMTGGSAVGAYVHEGHIPDETLEEYARSHARLRSTPRNRHMPLWLSGSWKWLSTMVSPAELQSVDSRNFTWKSACAIYGVHPDLIFHSSTSGAALGSTQRFFVKLTLMPLIRLLEGYLADLMPEGYRIRLLPKHLDADTLEMTRIVQRLVEIGIILPSEARERYMNLPELPGVDERYERLHGPSPGSEERGRDNQGGDGRETPNNHEDQNVGRPEYSARVGSDG